MSEIIIGITVASFVALLGTVGWFLRREFMRADTRFKQIDGWFKHIDGRMDRGDKKFDAIYDSLGNQARDIIEVKRTTPDKITEAVQIHILECPGSTKKGRA